MTSCIKSETSSNKPQEKRNFEESDGTLYEEEKKFDGFISSLFNNPESFASEWSAFNAMEDTSGMSKFLDFLLKATENEYYCLIDGLKGDEKKVSLFFYDQGLKFYKVVFKSERGSWISEKIVVLEKRPENLFFDHLVKDNKGNTVFSPTCRSPKYKEIYCNEGVCDTLRTIGREAYPAACGIMFIPENADTGVKDLKIRYLGVGNGINGYLNFKDGCMDEYFDASN